MTHDADAAIFSVFVTAKNTENCAIANPEFALIMNVLLLPNDLKKMHFNFM